MHVHSIPTVCLRSTSADNGPLETGFPGGAVNGIAQTADGYLWIGTDRGLIRFDGFNFRPVSFTSIAAASNVPILQLLTDAGGKLWVRPQGADLVRQKDGKFESVRYGSSPQSPPCQKITTAEYSFPTSSRALSVSRQTTFRNWDPLHPQ